ncbi:MAG TPA: DUF433 domain-containing protein [Candidatus Nanoarchaeia archaeon]|nr:DUF433 domain-containing protein [Candidatus Nanoarchaeia archaeon]
MANKTKEINIVIEPLNEFWNKTMKVFVNLDKDIFPKSETSVSFDNVQLLRKELRKNKFINNHIEINPKIMVNKPIIKGTRITVDLILNLLENGWARTKILKNYPQLKKDDIKAATALYNKLI